MKRFLLIIILLFQCIYPLKAQLILVPASGSSNLKLPKTIEVNYNQIPFVDDFSSYQGLTNPLKWQSTNVIVNSTYQFNPPTIGVATLDAIDIYGKLYPNASTTSFSADTLLSQPIRLDSIVSPSRQKLSKDDSIYFSFYIQPAGGSGQPWESIGTQPSMSDSIILDFYSQENGWEKVWSMGGIALDSIFAQENAYYKYVMIPIIEDKYFIKDFRFRFRNIASLNNNPQLAYIGNCDQWNIDYVYIDKDRSIEDTVMRELSFVDPAPSMLKRYQAMPAYQYIEQETADSLQIKIVNLYSSPLSSIYKYFIEDDQGNTLHTYDGGFENISPYITTLSYQEAVSHSRPAVNFNFPISQDNWQTFSITHTVKEGVGQDFLASNDTISFIQRFENYFAYDDGSAENGIGVEPIAGSHLAVSFKLNKLDTLTAVDIYFNSALNNANLKQFYICVWSSFGGLPLEILHKTEKLTPISDSLNRFVRFELGEEIILEEGEFFISLQTKGNDYLNIGFDRNTNSSQYTYSKTGVDWQQSFLSGSVMLRPYFGYKALVGLSEAKQELKFDFYPNPTSSKIFLQGIDHAEKQILDINGRLLITTKENEIDLSQFSQGVYILKVKNDKNSVAIRKIVKTK